MEPAAPPPEPTAERRRRARWRPEQGIGWGEGGRLTTRQKVVPVLAVLVLVGTLAYGLVPFEVAGAVECRGALRGAEPTADAPPGAIVGDPKRACRDAGNSRRATSAVVAVAAAALGVAGLLLPPEVDDEPDDAAQDAESA